MDLRVSEARQLSGRLSVPGDKSITHRAIMLASIATGVSTITGASTAADCRSTLEAMRALGVEATESEPGVLVVEGRDLRGLTEPTGVIDVGNSGTTIRILPGILAGQEFTTTLTGDESIRKRPMGRVIKPLKLMGAEITGEEGDTLAPMTIIGGKLKGITYDTPVASAQVKSAIIMAGLYAEGETRVTEPSRSRDHTERLLASMGADIGFHAENTRVRGGQTLRSIELEIPGDISSAAYLLTAALITEGSDVEVAGTGMNETRTGLLEVLELMGARLELGARRESGGEERADIRARASRLGAVEIDGAMIPRLIDEIPILAVAATQAEGETRITGAAELRVKESDRIAALASELRKMGAEIEELEDGLVVRGPVRLRGAEVESHGDHRIAMSLAVAALVAEGETVIRDADCVDISYPGFASALETLRS